MIIEGKIKCATCKSNQHVLINADEGFALRLNESVIGRWQCSKCGFINRLEIKNSEEDD